ncbi:MAG: cytochrome c [Myxococcota bacterium]
MRWTLLVLAGCGTAVERVAARDGDAEAGAAVYAAHCARCHGVDASGGVGPDLHGLDDPDELLADKILWGWGAMDGLRDELSNREAADVIAWLDALGEA